MWYFHVDSKRTQSYIYLHTHTYTHSPPSSLPSRLPHNIEQFPVLYSRSLLVMHFKYNIVRFWYQCHIQPMKWLGEHSFFFCFLGDFFLRLICLVSWRWIVFFFYKSFRFSVFLVERFQTTASVFLTIIRNFNFFLKPVWVWYVSLGSFSIFARFQVYGH